MKIFKNLKSSLISYAKKSSSNFTISVFLIFFFIMTVTAFAVWMNWESITSQKGVKEYLIQDEKISDKYFSKKTIKYREPLKLTSVEISNLIDKSETEENKTIFNIIPKISLDSWTRSKNFSYKEDCQDKNFFANGSLGYCNIKNLVNSIFILWKKENIEPEFMDDRIFINVFEFPDETYVFSENVVESYHLSSQLEKLPKITFEDKTIQRHKMMRIYKSKSDQIIKEYFYLDAFTIDKFVITLFYIQNYQDQADNIIRKIILKK